MEKRLIKDFLGQEAPEGDISLEIELESNDNNKKLPEISTVWWQSVSDGSLRNGMEYITKKPLPYDTRTKERIEFLFKTIGSGNKSKLISTSHRTSVHVHSNISRLTPTQAWTVACAYWMFENVLFEYCNKDRKGNHFCLRLKDAEDLVEICFKEISSFSLFSQIRSDQIKYSGLNLNAMHKFGSFEYRALEGTTDAAKIYNWAATLHVMKENAVKFWENPEDLLNYYYKNGWESTAKLLFYSAPLLLFITSMKNAEDLVEENVYRLIKIAYGVSWTNYNKATNKKKAVSKANPRPTVRPWLPNTTITWSDIPDLPEDTI